MNVFYIDESWPIVCIKLTGSPKTEEDIQKIIKIWTNIYIVSMSYDQKFKLIFDARDVHLNNMELLKPLAKFLINVKQLTEKWMDRTSIIVSSDKIRNLIKFVFMLYKPVRPFKVFTDDNKSLKWLNSNEPGEDPEMNFLKEKRKPLKSKISF